MRIAVVASGSMGDVRPYAMLAGAFAQAGWDAGLVANDGYAGLADEFGCRWFRAALPPLAQVKAWQRRQNAQQAGLFDGGLWDDWFACYPALLAALDGAAVIASRIPWIADFAGVLARPFVLAANLPRGGLRADLPHIRSVASIGRVAAVRRLAAAVPGALPALNLLSYGGAAAAQMALLWRERRSLGALRGLQQRHQAALAALGGSVVAPPAPPLLATVALSASILPPRPGERFTGVWRRPEPDYRPPAELARLLADGRPCVYFGFGSVPCMPDGADLSALSRVIAAAAAQADVGAIIAPGWGGLRWAGEARGVEIGEVPHDWLFPRVDAILHHCGVGTSVAALAAGRPSIPVPFLQDEPFWAWRLHDLGVAPPPLDPRRIDVAALAAALRQAVGDPGLRARAAALGQAIRAEDGLGRMVRLVEDAMAAGAPASRAAE